LPAVGLPVAAPPDPDMTTVVPMAAPAAPAPHALGQSSAGRMSPLTTSSPSLGSPLTTSSSSLRAPFTASSPSLPSTDFRADHDGGYAPKPPLRADPKTLALESL